MSADTDVLTALPLTEVTYFILLSLSPRAKHGYAIMKDVRLLSQGRVVLSTGTLYGALKRLLELGWVAPVEDPAANHNGRVRKTYRLTGLGRQVLEAEVLRLEGLVHAAQLHAARENP
jgi:DNA-binding PadR family transcriptional regulator